MTHPTSNLLSQLEAWMKDEGAVFACTRQYPNPRYASDFDPQCAGCLIEHAALELRKHSLSDNSSAPETPAHFQGRVHQWMRDCFISDDAFTPEQRTFRFTEEGIELAQAGGISKADVLRLVEYVYSRPRGAVSQEIGGVSVTLAALATAYHMTVESCAEAELSRCVANTEKIRAKDLTKPKRSPLPGSVEETADRLCSDCPAPEVLDRGRCASCPRRAVKAPRSP